MRKQTLVYFEEKNLNELDKFVIRPCNRSDLINDAVEYLTKNPYVLESFVKTHNENHMRKIRESENRQ